MNCNTQNARIAEVDEKTLVVGIDVGSEYHYARAFDNRGVEYSKKAFKFGNTEDGFEAFKAWILSICKEQSKNKVIPGMEPTGHYWFNLGKYLQDNGMRPVLVNPFHVKTSKELDDNNPTKNDRKDPKVIAGLVKDGRYTYPYLPTGIYAELRTASNLRYRLQSELTGIENRLARWFSIYFPEYKTVYGNLDAISGLMVLKTAPLPEDIVALGVDGVNQIWREAKMRAVGKKRAQTLVAAAEHSIGTTEGLTAARYEIRLLLEDYESRSEKLKEVMDELVDQGKACEMVIVTPCAGGAANKDWNGYFNMRGWHYEDFFFKEFMPFIEQEYRILTDRGHRAAAGLSMGGGAATSFCQRYPDLFCACYAMSALMDIVPLPGHKAGPNSKVGIMSAKVGELSCSKFIRQADAATIAKMKTIRWYVDCGDRDFLLKKNQEFMAAMDRAGIPYQKQIRKGTHSWKYWHTGLYICLPFITESFEK